jgi:hypothetical protein
MPRFFAWQFLRRNPEYQETYSKLRKTVDKIDLFLNNRRPGISSNCVVGNYGYNQPGGIYCHSRDRGNVDLDTEKLIRTTSYKFLLPGWMPDPANNEFIMPFQVLTQNICCPPFDLDEDTKPFCKILKPGHRLVDIDLRYPLQPQIDIAEGNLREEQADYLGDIKPQSGKKDFYLYLHCHGDPPHDLHIPTNNSYRRLKLIDLYYTIRPQLELHHQWWRVEQNRMFGKILRPTLNARDDNSLVRYLRILDAYASEAKPIEIARVLYPHLATTKITNCGSEKHINIYSPAHCAVYDDRNIARSLLKSDWTSLIPAVSHLPTSFLNQRRQLKSEETAEEAAEEATLLCYFFHFYRQTP